MTITCRHGQLARSCERCADDCVIEELRARVVELERNHCKDCCCARSWEALGITAYTGMSIPEHIEELKQTAARVAELEQAIREAPHPYWCGSQGNGVSVLSERYCNCWKRDALEKGPCS